MAPSDKPVTLALRSNQLPAKAWQEVLSDALYSIRSFLCTSINCTPHEQLFSFKRKSASGTSIPSWMATPGPVLLKRYARSSKFDPFVDEVELIEANPLYAHVRFPAGYEDTVSNKRLPSSGNIGKPLAEHEQQESENKEQLCSKNTGVDEHEPEPTPLLSPNEQSKSSTSRDTAPAKTPLQRSGSPPFLRKVDLLNSLLLLNLFFFCSVFCVLFFRNVIYSKGGK